MVATGGVTTVDAHLQLGEQKETVTVDTIGPQIELESHTIDQVITRKQIQELPLNGRGFLQLAFLSPGRADFRQLSRATYNRAMDVRVLGGDPDCTRIAVDGARINDCGGWRHAAEFLAGDRAGVSDLERRISISPPASRPAGAINIVTRTGSNRFHGSGFFFFRDHNMAAYPGLQRDPLAPDPFFARRQSGLWVGGPVIKDRLFFFAAYEHNNQNGVFTSVPTDAGIHAALARVTSSPQARRPGERPPRLPHQLGTHRLHTLLPRRQQYVRTARNQLAAFRLGEQYQLGGFRRLLTDQHAAADRGE